MRREICGQRLGIKNPLMLDSGALLGNEEFIPGALLFHGTGWIFHTRSLAVGKPFVVCLSHVGTVELG